MKLVGMVSKAPSNGSQALSRGQKAPSSAAVAAQASQGRRLLRLKREGVAS
jgi:hypothetical protein